MFVLSLEKESDKKKLNRNTWIRFITWPSQVSFQWNLMSSRLTRKSCFCLVVWMKLFHPPREKKLKEGKKIVYLILWMILFVRLSVMQSSQKWKSCLINILSASFFSCLLYRKQGSFRRLRAAQKILNDYN